MLFEKWLRSKISVGVGVGGLLCAPGHAGAAAPDTMIVTVEPNPTNDPTGDFAFGSDQMNVAYECSVDGGAFAVCPQMHSTVNLPDGTHTLAVRAIDGGGNVDPSPATYTWVIDTVAPDTMIVTAEPNPTSDPTGDFSFGSNEMNVLYECSIDGGAFASCSQTYSTVSLPDGTHTISVRVKDAAGNLDPTPATYTWVIDGIAPDTMIPTSEPNPTNDPTGDFTFGSNEMNVTYQCSIDGGAFVVCPATYSTVSLSDGTHTISVRAKDAADNLDPTPAIYTWIIDTAPPNTTIVTSEPNPTNDPTGDFVFSSPDMTATFECSIDNGAYAACSANYSTAFLPDGLHTISVRAKDAAGNVDPTPAARTWVVDTMAPDTSILTSEPNSTNDSKGDFTFGSNEMNVTYECSIDGGAFAACPQTYSTVSLPDGIHTIAVRAKDTAGNVDPTPATYSWIIDTLPPDTTVLTSEPNPTNDPTGDFTFGSNEMNVTYECNIDGGAYVSCTQAYSTPSLADGTHTIVVRAKDAAGNVDPAPATYTWVIDTVVPDTTILASEPNPTNDPSGDFTFASNEMNVTYECSIDGGPFGACPQTYSTVSLPDGSHKIAVRAKDTAGNVDLAPATYAWFIDTESPDTTIVVAEPTPTTDPTGDFVFSSPDMTATFECSIDGGAFAACSATYSTVSLADGTHTISVRAKDAADNVDPTPADCVWSIDTSDYDIDDDGLSNYFETQIGTDPNDADSDDDGVIDGLEINMVEDSDGDGQINPLDSDSDDDGLFDGTEMGFDCANPATDTSRMQCIPDADMGTTLTSPLNADTDQGGIDDGIEDANHNGKIDTDEPDPNDPVDDNVVLPPCGNGVLDADETCDDGNTLDDDGCDHDCSPTACGNGILTTGEQCDDGNLVDGDGCSLSCQPDEPPAGGIPDQPAGCACSVPARSAAPISFWILLPLAFLRRQRRLGKDGEPK